MAYWGLHPEPVGVHMVATYHAFPNMATTIAHVHEAKSYPNNLMHHHTQVATAQQIKF